MLQLREKTRVRALWKENSTEMQGDGLPMDLRSNHYLLAEEDSALLGGRNSVL